MSTNNPYHLTEDERRTYEKDGFFIRPQMYTADEADALSGHIEDLALLIESSDILSNDQKNAILKRVAKTEKTGIASLNSLTRFHRFSATVRAHIRDERHLAIAQDLLGPDLFCPNDLYFFKPPGTGKPIAWHQDSWYFSNTFISSVGDRLEDASIGTWLALDDADETNGCLWVIPGSHKLGVMDHEDVEGSEYFLQKRVKVDDQLEAQGIPVEVPKGALIIFNNALLHRSTTNRSQRFRRAYVVHYMKATIGPTEQMLKRAIPPAEQYWGSPEMYVCGQQHPDCIQTTPDKNSLNWDRALGRNLTEKEIGR